MKIASINGILTPYLGAPATPKPSTPAKHERTSGPTTPTSNDTIPREDEDHKMDVDA